MNLVEAAEKLLSMRLGLSRELLTGGVLEHALDIVFAKERPGDLDYKAAKLLEDQGEEWQMLVDEVIVPETWFFRHYKSFQFLVAFVNEKWRLANPIRPFHVLCIPCASGEEPYSIVMTLLDTGLDAGRIRIDAADVSERLLARARLGVYGKSSFREEVGRFQEKYFVQCEESWQICECVTRSVRFEKANLLDLSLFRPRAPYDVIFCRNALIYLDDRARRIVVSQLSELLDEEGLLFTGPPELAHFCGAGYVSVDFPESFACRKANAALSDALAPSSKASEAAAKPQSTVTTRGEKPQVARRPASTSSDSEPSSSLERAEKMANRGDLDAAIAICEELLEKDVQNPDVYALLGVIHESLGTDEIAEEFFRRALYLSPDHYQSLLQMSLLCERRGDVEGARLYRGRAVRALNRNSEKPVLEAL